jgi:dihydrodipicolinate synthase/N-acetylneuraminate lyase
MSAQPRGPLSGVVAATVTPLRDSGRRIDEAAVSRLVDFYARAGISGVFVAGSTGEGLLLSTRERIALAESFLEAARGRLAVAVHAGAQSTAEAVSLAEHARDVGADAVAAIGPPYYRYDDDELLAHFHAVASASAPVPLYLYEFRDRTGYALPANVVRMLVEREPNVVGIKVSDRSLDELRRYMLPELDVFVGAEALIPDALAMGAVGAVSGLAAAMPSAVVRIFNGLEPGAHATSLRDALAAYPLQAALKTALVAQGVLDDASVRAPLRGLTDPERAGCIAWLAEIGTSTQPAAGPYETSPAA